jgi:hypothetical protein
VPQAFRSSILKSGEKKKKRKAVSEIIILVSAEKLFKKPKKMDLTTANANGEQQQGF